MSITPTQVPQTPNYFIRNVSPESKSMHILFAEGKSPEQIIMTSQSAELAYALAIGLRWAPTLATIIETLLSIDIKKKLNKPLIDYAINALHHLNTALSLNGNFNHAKIRRMGPKIHDDKRVILAILQQNTDECIEHAAKAIAGYTHLFTLREVLTSLIDAHCKGSTLENERAKNALAAYESSLI